jgi:hypothetical protein
MSGYQEADDQETIDRLRKALPPPAAEVGQLVWWTDLCGSTIFEGRIDRVEIGHYSGHYAVRDEDATRRYVARSEKALHLSFKETYWRDHAHQWEDENMSGTFMDDEWSKFCFTFDVALEKAAKARDEWADEAERQAKERREDAARWRSLKTKAAAA